MAVKLSLMDKLRALLDDDATDADAVDDTVDDVADDVDADATDDEADAVDDEADAVDDEADAVDDEDDETPGGEDAATEADSAQVAELRATILAQAAQLETYRNRLAELGEEDPIDTDDADVDDEDADTEDDDEDIVAAFDTDYAKHKARLAEITEGKN
jgi:hypothetical protein